MSEFPHEVDLTKTPHFLFELGSIMTTIFSALLLVWLPIFAVSLWLKTYVAPATMITGVLALLAANGVLFLLLSSRYPATQPTRQ